LDSSREIASTDIGFVLEDGRGLIGFVLEKLVMPISFVLEKLAMPIGFVLKSRSGAIWVRLSCGRAGINPMNLVGIQPISTLYYH